jgi:endonuclease/exonuclease/phosphatase family metal-dependent hydrolase
VAPLPTRGLLHGEIKIPDRDITLHVMAIHLGLLQYERRKQLKQVCRYVHDETGPGSICVIGGDFNDWRQLVTKRFSNSLKLDEAYLSQNDEHARTFPSRMPVLRLDRIYFRGLDLVKANCLKGKPWLFLSDHLPLMADFELR